MNALPAYLQNRQSAALSQRATEGLGGNLPPHVSIRGNTFTLIDGAGAEHALGATLDCAIIDRSDVVCKRYYDKPFDPKAEGEPPTCWSANGVAPSREAIEPQSPTCAACPNNVRGSATSNISGKAIKACRDELWLGLLLPQYPTMLFQMILAPGSFKNWKAFTEPFKSGNAVDISDVVTRVTFEPKTNGVLVFQATAYIDEKTAEAREKALTAKVTDILVGRNDVPYSGAALVTPTKTYGLLETPITLAATETANAAPAFGGGNGAATPFGAPSAGFQPTGTAQPQPNGQPAPAASPSDGRRKRRTRAEIDADNAAAQAPAGPAAAPIAPFTPQPMASGPTPGPAFGIGAGVEPNAEMQETLNSIFK